MFIIDLLCLLIADYSIIFFIKSLNLFYSHLFSALIPNFRLFELWGRFIGSEILIFWVLSLL